MKEHDEVTGICACGKPVLCVVVKFKNDTLHLKGFCHACKKSGWMQQQTQDLDAIKFKIDDLEKRIIRIKPQIDFEEAVAMLERLAKRLMEMRGFSSW